MIHRIKGTVVIICRAARCEETCEAEVEYSDLEEATEIAEDEHGWQEGFCPRCFESVDPRDHYHEAKEARLIQ